MKRIYTRNVALKETRTNIRPVRLLLMSEIDSSSKPYFEEEIIKCVVLDYVIYSPVLQKAAATSSSYPCTSTIQKIISNQRQKAIWRSLTGNPKQTSQHQACGRCS